MTPEEQQKITDARTYLVIQEPGLTQLTLMSPVMYSPKFPPFGATNGRSVLLGDAWMKMSVKQKAGVYVHELEHIMLRHVQTAHRMLNLDEPNDFKLFNIAADGVINYNIRESKHFELPEGGVEIRDLLQKIPNAKSPDEWTSVELYLALKQLNGGDSGKTLKDLGYGSWEIDLIEADDSEAMSEEQKQFNSLPDEVKKRIFEKAIRAGSGSSNILRNLLKELEPDKINWSAIVKNILKQYCSPKFTDNWNRPSRLSLAKVFPFFDPDSQPKKSVKRVGWVVDTSGSMDEDDVSRGLNLVISAQKMLNFDLIFMSADADVCSRDQVKATQNLKEKIRSGKLQVKGGGGTDFKPAIRAMEAERVDCLFYFTDGYGSFGEEPKVRTFWLMTTDVKAPYGRTINLNQAVS